MTVKFTNNASSSLSSGINSTATSLTVADASTFPSLSGADDYCYLTIQQATATVREVVKATARSGNTFTVQRGVDNTTAASFSSGDTVELRLTSALLQDVIDQATVEGIKTNFQYVPTAGQTQFSGADNSGDTMIINDSELVNVYMNGVRLVQGSDYTVSSANNRITLATGATTADVIDIEVFGNFTGQSGAAVAITGGAIAGTAITTGSINNTPIGATQANTVAATTLTANSVAVDNITIDGNEIDVPSGNLTLDVVGGITLDADGGQVDFKDNGTLKALIDFTGNNVEIQSRVTDADLIFRGQDGSSFITALRLDMSEAGNAHFNQHAYFVDNGYVVLGAGEDVKIHSDGTNGTIATQNGSLTLDVAADLTLDADDGGHVRFKDGGTQYASIFKSGSGAIIDTPSGGDLKLDVAGNIKLDADDNGEVRLLDGGTQYLYLKKDNNTAVIENVISNGAIQFRGIDGSTAVAALTLDMSAAGAATFNAGATVNGDTDIRGGATPLGVYRTLALAVDTQSEIALGSQDLSNNYVDAARIRGLLKANKTGGELSFYTLNSSALHERLRIEDDGNIAISGAGVSVVATNTYHVRLVNTTNQVSQLNYNSNASFTQDLHAWDAIRAGSSAFNFGRWRSNVGGSPDSEFIFNGAGTATADGSWNGGGADYAEYFEWADGNSSNEDRVGVSVKLDGTKIVPSTSSDDPSEIIGVISANPSVVGDTAGTRWQSKYERDDYNRYIYEAYTFTEWTVPATETEEAIHHIYPTDYIPSDVTVPSDAVVISKDEDGNNLMRKKLNSSFDESLSYVPRSDRKEWDTVGLMGKIRMTKGQKTGTNWIKMRDISDTVEEWLIR
tara:strand:- start:1750 stop:4293 length:2544 start_codon:yes stop_codon:yes gene_type:complete